MFLLEMTGGGDSVENEGKVGTVNHAGEHSKQKRKSIERSKSVGKTKCQEEKSSTIDGRMTPSVFHEARDLRSRKEEWKKETSGEGTGRTRKRVAVQNRGQGICRNISTGLESSAGKKKKNPENRREGHQK